MRKKTTTWKAAGNDASGSNTQCDATKCEVQPPAPPGLRTLRTKAKGKGKGEGGERRKGKGKGKGIEQSHENKPNPSTQPLKEQTLKEKTHKESFQGVDGNLHPSTAIAGRKCCLASDARSRHAADLRSCMGPHSQECWS